MRLALSMLAALLALPACAGEEAVRFASGDIELAGTLSLPEAGGPFPAVVLISGSGPSDRDESLDAAPIKPFKLIADYLAGHGIAVLRYDDRGTFESGGSYGGATLEDFAQDAAGAVVFLAAREEIRDDAIGLLGHSEGGMIAPMVAATDPEVAFVIAIAAPAVDGYTLLMSQIEDQLKIVPPEQQPRLLSQKQALDLIRADDWAGLEANLRAEYQLVRENYVGSEQDYVTGGLHFFRGWLQSFVLNNPSANWAQISVPVLGLYAERDAQVSTPQNAAALEAAFAGKADAIVTVLPDLNHLLQDAPTGAMSEYPTLPPEFAPNVLPTLASWINERFGAP